MKGKSLRPRPIGDRIMAWCWNNTSRIVRPRSIRHTPLAPCLLAFAATASLLYYWSSETGIIIQGEPAYSATAFVLESSPGSPGEPLRIPIAYTDEDPDRAKEVADALADRYVEDRISEWSCRWQATLHKAGKVVEAAKEEVTQCEAALQRFRQRTADATGKVHEAKARVPAPTMVENPQWIKLNLQLAELEQRRERLLLDRTPLHPSVVDLTSQMDDLKTQMAAIPQKVPAAEKPAEDQKARPAGSTPANDVVAKHNREKMQALTAAVEKAYRSLAAAENTVARLKSQQVVPPYTIAYAKVEKITSWQPSDKKRLLWTTLAAGVLMAFGVGSVTTGISIEPVAANAAQVQADAHTTVIGSLPAEAPVSDPAKLSRRQMRGRHVLMAVGFLLMAACPIVALWGTIGI